MQGVHAEARLPCRPYGTPGFALLAVRAQCGHESTHDESMRRVIVPLIYLQRTYCTGKKTPGYGVGCTRYAGSNRNSVTVLVGTLIQVG